MSGQAAMVTYVNTGDTPEECLEDATSFFIVAANLHDLTLLSEATIKLNSEGHGDGKPWRGRFHYESRKEN